MPLTKGSGQYIFSRRKRDEIAGKYKKQKNDAS
jgi:hypothetical protein